MTKCAATDAELGALFCAGKTLQEIGDQYGITRERVRQKISRIGIKATEGGRSVISERSRKQRTAKRDLACIKKYGCTWDHYKKILKAPRTAFGVRPTMGYASQRSAAYHRGIEWNMTLAEWWAVWQASGKWELRGRGQGYAMCRKNDRGAYEVGNVYIAGLGDNGREYQARRRGKSFTPQSEVFEPA